jgi:hypothetical protein
LLASKGGGEEGNRGRGEEEKRRRGEEEKRRIVPSVDSCGR